MEIIKDLLEVIKEDYKIPKYRCEVVIDTLLSIFSIDEIVNKCAFGGKEKDIKFVAKEFPFKKKENKQSFNVDYLLINEANKTLYLVELKTTNLVNSKQLIKYIEIKNKIKEKQSAQFLIEDFDKIKSASEGKGKFKYEEYEEKYLKQLEERHVFEHINNAEIVYILPKPPHSKDIKNLFEQHDIKCITFKNLYKDMKFDKEDENNKWNNIKEIFEYIDKNN